jgi:hypothetical protein
VSVTNGHQLATLVGARHALLDASGERALAWTEAGPPRVWDIAADRPGASLAATAGYRAIGFADGGRAVVLDENAGEATSHTLTIWEAETGRRVDAIADSIARPAISAGGRSVTTVVASGGIAMWSFAEHRVRTLSAEPLQQAELDPGGHLLAGIASHGEAVLVLDADDGRVLARWEIAHDSPIVEPSTFESALASAAWSRDGRSIVTRSQRIAVWNTEIDLPGNVAEVVDRNVPWRVDDGRLIPVSTTARSGTRARSP